MSSNFIAGIDLGTTNSALAVIQDHAIKVVNIHGQPTMPSCVGLDPLGKLIVGQAAKNQLISAPDATILSIKRKMGQETRVSLGEKQYSPEEISSFILRELKSEAERELGSSIEKAVITVPAFFNDRQRKATQVAGELAGLEVVRIINEPTAAALAYGAGRTEDETMLVYDLGGGTFDVSAVVVEEGVVEVKASHGDTLLGGDDFDDLLVAHAIREFKRQHGADLSADGKTLRRLKVVMERAKCRLSDDPFVFVREEYLDGSHHLELELRRTEYEQMISHFIEKTLDCIHKSMQDAKLAPADLDKVMLVGGSTRTPMVHRLLHERLGVEPRFEINPDLIVAMGAAVQAGNMSGQKPSAILVDITAHTFSTASLGHREDWQRLICTPIISRNTPLPVSKSELFFTACDEQKAIKVTAYQGENEFPEENTLIGDFLVEGLRPVPAGNQVVIRFDLDLGGMLKVTASEKETGLSKTVTMDTRGLHTLDVDAARRNIAALVGDTEEPAEDADDPEETDADHDELLNTAKDLRKRGEALAQKNISPEDAQEIHNLIHQSAELISASDWPGLEDCNSRLSDLLFYLED